MIGALGTPVPTDVNGLKHLHSVPAGIRAQAVSPDGAMVDDFLIQENNRIINVCNAPSPAATSSLNIGATIAKNLSSRF